MYVPLFLTLVPMGNLSKGLRCFWGLFWKTWHHTIWETRDWRRNSISYCWCLGETTEMLIMRSLLSFFIPAGKQLSEAQLYRTNMWSHLWPCGNCSKLWSNCLALRSSTKQMAFQPRSLFYLMLPALRSFRCLVNARVYFYQPGNAFHWQLWQ